jgi:lysophospholipase L1-like esterase
MNRGNVFSPPLDVADDPCSVNQERAKGIMRNVKKHSVFILLALVAHLPCLGQQVEAKESKAKAVSENTATIPVQKLESDFYNWHQRHKEVLGLIKKKPVDLIFIGDSITHMFGGVPKSRIARGSRIWKEYYGHRNAINMGFGWDRTQNVLWRLENGGLEGILPKVAVVLIGTNNMTGTKNARENSPAEIAEGVEAICKTIHKKVPKCKILLLGVIPRGGGRFIKPIKETNDMLALLGENGLITFLNMGEQLGGRDGMPRKELMNDNAHPNAAGYQVWAETMEPVLSKLLDDKAVVPNKPDAGGGR